MAEPLIYITRILEILLSESIQTGLNLVHFKRQSEQSKLLELEPRVVLTVWADARFTPFDSASGDCILYMYCTLLYYLTSKVSRMLCLIIGKVGRPGTVGGVPK